MEETTHSLDFTVTGVGVSSTVGGHKVVGRGTLTGVSEAFFPSHRRWVEQSVVPVTGLAQETTALYSALIYTVPAVSKDAIQVLFGASASVGFDHVKRPARVGAFFNAVFDVRGLQSGAQPLETFLYGAFQYWDRLVDEIIRTQTGARLPHSAEQQLAELARSVVESGRATEQLSVAAATAERDIVYYLAGANISDVEVPADIGADRRRLTRYLCQSASPPNGRALILGRSGFPVRYWAWDRRLNPFTPSASGEAYPHDASVIEARLVPRVEESIRELQQSQVELAARLELSKKHLDYQRSRLAFLRGEPGAILLPRPTETVVPPTEKDGGTSTTPSGLVPVSAIGDTQTASPPVGRSSAPVETSRVTDGRDPERLNGASSPAPTDDDTMFALVRPLLRFLGLVRGSDDQPTTSESYIAEQTGMDSMHGVLASTDGRAPIRLDNSGSRARRRIMRTYGIWFFVLAVAIAFVMAVMVFTGSTDGNRHSDPDPKGRVDHAPAQSENGLPSEPLPIPVGTQLSLPSFQGVTTAGGAVQIFQRHVDDNFRPLGGPTPAGQVLEEYCTAAVERMKIALHDSVADDEVMELEREFRSISRSNGIAADVVQSSGCAGTGQGTTPPEPIVAACVALMRVIQCQQSP